MTDRDPPIRTLARIERAHSPRHFEASLPNGAPVHAHIPARNRAAIGPLRPGDRVPVELTPFDFSHARIAGPAVTGVSDEES